VAVLQVLRRFHRPAAREKKSGAEPPHSKTFGISQPWERQRLAGEFLRLKYVARG
jgi:hypothetical protein